MRRIALNIRLNFMHKKFLNIITANVFGCLFTASFAYADINIAVIAPREGEYAKVGKELIDGARIAVDDINMQGGLNGQKINLIAIDDRCDDVFAVSTAQMLAVNRSPKDKMHLVVGPYCSNAFKEASGIYAKAGIFQIVPTPISTDASSEPHAGLLKMLAGNERQSLDFFKFYLENFDGENVALVYDSQLRDVVEVAFSVQQEFNKSGKSQHLKTFNFANYENSYGKMAENILEEKTALALILGKSRDIAKLAKKLKQEDENFVVFTNKYQAQARFEEELGKRASGTYFLALPSLKDNPEFTEILVKLRLLGVEPEGLSVYSYSAVNLWRDLAERAGSFAYQDLVKNLNGNKFETAWGEVEFVNGQPVQPLNYAIYCLDNGEYTQVY